ncbi:28804_t:CDS:2 [Dentiscutata erythropus]|uniref:28804_t:CDS:1 n=1 Tax=Dentiscutata erythropus TaxID=1348616 RepID=A0A9N9FVY6_9GLOM|nr:28804_t:CDS:2 [Dentiscutata erythropus]
MSQGNKLICEESMPEENTVKSDENNKKRKIDDKNYKPHLSGEYEISSDSVIDGFQVVGDAVQPFLPLFQSVQTILDSIVKAYRNGKCNQKICLALIDRVEIAQQAVKSLQRQQMENEERFRKQDYYNAWIRFVTVLENINKFVKEVTQLSSLQKFLTANAVKDAFDKNIKEFEEVCKDLNFTLAVYDINKKDIENKKIMEDINVLNKIMNYVNDNLNEQKKELAQLSEKFEQLMKRTSSIDTTLLEAYREPEINPRELSLDHSENDSGKNILKRSYRGLKVACKKILVEKNDVKSHAEFAILRRLGTFRNKKREKLLLDPSPIAQELFKIIKQAWNHNPSERPQVMNVLSTLKEAYEKFVPKGASPMILPKHISDSNIPSYSLSPNMNEGPHSDERNFEKLPEDYKRLSLDNIPNNSKEYSEIIKYIKMSADNGNEIAYYNLAIIYMEGLYSEPINKEKAKHYARLAALKNYSKAIELLKKLNR